MSDLAQLLTQFEREEYAASVGAQLPETRRQAVRGKVVRARRVRAAATIAVAAVAAVACATGAWALTQQDRNDPAVPHPSPTVTSSIPSPSPTPSTSATPEPELTMPAFTGDVTVDPQLPTAEAITPEAWNAAGPGWVLATYREQSFTWDDSTQTDTELFGPQMAYLISPDGVRRQLTTIPGDSRVRVAAWTPLATDALAIEQKGPQSGPTQNTWVVLDLVTGATRALTDADVTASEWTTADLDRLSDTTVWAFGFPDQQIDGSTPLDGLAPAPATSAGRGDLDAARATAQALVPAGERCDGTLTLDTMVAVACGTGLTMNDGSVEGWFAHYFVFVGDSGAGPGTVVDVRVPSEYGNDSLILDDVFGHATAIDDTVIATAVEESVDPCWAGRFDVTSAGAHELPGVASLRQSRDGLNIFLDMGSAGDDVYTAVTGGCSGDAQPAALVRDNITDGTWTVIIPFPTDHAGADTTGWITESLLSAYVVPERR